MLVTRVLSALVLIPLVAVAAFLGGPWFAGLVAIFAILAVIEFYQLADRLGAHACKPVGVLLTLILVLAALFPSRPLGPAAFILVLGALMLIRVLQQRIEGFLADWSATLVGSAYVGGMLSHFVLLRGLAQGLTWVALAAVTTWVCDTGAYFVGSTLGKHRFFPRISPRKTWEGAIGGLLAGTLTGVAMGVLLLHIAWPLAALVGLATSLAATFGDLAKSLIKRQAGMKNSGTLIPGHGGALDRVDSLLFAGVVVYYFAVWVIGVR